jgi:hypothetical protein
MSAHSTCRARALAALLLVLLPNLFGCAKSATNPPGGTFSGHVTLAAGQTGDVNQSQVQIYMKDPFSAGATPVQMVLATGSATDATYQFGDLGHGDFYLVAWKDTGDLVVDSGDLRGWYNGGVSGTGAPVATIYHLLHGEKASINFSMSAIPGPQTSPGGGGQPQR